MNIVVTERDKKLLRLVACLAIIVIFGMYLIRPAMENHETLQNEYDAAEQKQQEYQTQIAALATIMLLSVRTWRIRSWYSIL